MYVFGGFLYMTSRFAILARTGMNHPCYFYEVRSKRTGVTVIESIFKKAY